jgi:hypothetical protein
MVSLLVFEPFTAMMTWCFNLLTLIFSVLFSRMYLGFGGSFNSRYVFGQGYFDRIEYRVPSGMFSALPALHVIYWLKYVNNIFHKLGSRRGL